MDLCRNLLSQALELLEEFSCWTPEESEAIGRKILSSARRVCQGDEDLVRANLIEALILSCQEELADNEREMLKELTTRLRKAP